MNQLLSLRKFPLSSPHCNRLLFQLFSRQLNHLELHLAYLLNSLPFNRPCSHHLYQQSSQLISLQVFQVLSQPAYRHASLQYSHPLNQPVSHRWCHLRNQPFNPQVNQQNNLSQGLLRSHLANHRASHQSSPSVVLPRNLHDNQVGAQPGSHLLSRLHNHTHILPGNLLLFLLVSQLDNLV